MLLVMETVNFLLDRPVALLIVLAIGDALEYQGSGHHAGDCAPARDAVPAILRRRSC